MDPYLRPIFDVFGTHWNRKTILDMITYGELEISPLAYMRGRTFTRAFIIADEMQNANAEQLIMLLTRLGEDSKMVITGDPMQKDIPNSGFEIAKRKLQHVPSIGFVNFSDADVVRHPTVKNILSVWNNEGKIVANDTPVVEDEGAVEDVEAELGKLPSFITQDYREAA
jgi:phosphate starvation-inducible PhoH-like protein